jgi:hypothetical protein
MNRPLPQLRIFGLLVGSIVMVSCASEVDDYRQPWTIQEATFVAVMAELQHATNHTLDGALDPASRNAILERMGVQPDDLLTFADVHGPDVTYMLMIWTEVARATRELATQAPVPDLIR